MKEAKEDAAMAAIPKFRALPVNATINMERLFAGKRIPKKELTVPRSPMLRTKSRSRASSASRGAENVRP